MPNVKLISINHIVWNSFGYFFSP